jgi:pSer/pThr/pTyr-binding forkhead associated (FHA) protein
MDSPVGAHRSTPAELQARMQAERRGLPFLVYRDDGGAQRIKPLDGHEKVVVGRRAESDVSLEWDTAVSRLHARLELVAGDWTVLDDGLSQNGTYVNGERISGRLRLVDGDLLRIGRTVILYRAPARRPVESIVTDVDDVLPVQVLTETQRKVLMALCRPFRASTALVAPATNQEIADELVLSVDSVKGHLRALYERFGLEDMPQSRKRIELVRRALDSGLV